MGAKARLRRSLIDQVAKVSCCSASSPICSIDEPLGKKVLADQDQVSVAQAIDSAQAAKTATLALNPQAVIQLLHGAHTSTRLRDHAI